MKKRLGLMMVVTVLMMMSACADHFCPTYSGTKNYSEHRVSAKKVKPSKGKIAATKSLKFAETD